jgi:hypothetical protein
MSRVNLFSVLIVDLIFSTPPFRISPAIGLLETRISISKMVNQTNEFRNIPLLPHKPSLERIKEFLSSPGSRITYSQRRETYLKPTIWA